MRNGSISISSRCGSGLWWSWPGPVANFLLSIVLFALLLGTFGDLGRTPRIGSVVPGSPAARAGFQTGDLVTAADGRRINDFSDISTYTMLRADQPIRFTVRRGAASLDLLATPERKVVANPVTGASKLGFLGVGSSLAPADTFRRRYNPLQALGGGVSRSWEQIETTVFYISRIFRGQESGDQLRSFLGIAKVSGQFAHAGAEGAPNAGAKVLGVMLALTSADRRALGEHRFRQPFAFAGAGRWAPCVLRL